MQTRRSFFGALAAILAAPAALLAKPRRPKPRPKRSHRVALLTMNAREWRDRWGEAPTFDSCGGTFVLIWPADSEIKKAFDLPDDTVITGVSPHVRFMKNEVVVRIEHPKLDEVLEGHLIPTVHPLWVDTSNFESDSRTLIGWVTDPDEIMLHRCYTKWFARFECNAAGHPLIAGPGVTVKPV